MCFEGNVILLFINFIRFFIRNIIDEYLDMLMVCYYFDKYGCFNFVYVFYNFILIFFENKYYYKEIEKRGVMKIYDYF